MKKLSIVFACVAALSLVGCKKKDAAGGGAATCDAMGAAMIKMSPAQKDMAPAIVKACKDDKWSTEALSCMIGAKDEASGKACMAKLTPAQTGNMMKAMMGGMDMDKMLGDAMGKMGDALGSAAAAMGSAAAAAGSAAGSAEPTPTAVPADGSAAAPADGSAAAPAADGSAAAGSAETK